MKIKQVLLEDLAYLKGFQYHDIEADIDDFDTVELTVDGAKCYVKYDPFTQSLEDVLTDLFQRVRQYRSNAQWLDE